MGAIVAILAVINGVLAVIVVSLLRSHADILKALHDAGIRTDGHSTTSLSLTPAFDAGRIPDEGTALAVDALDIVGESPDGDALSISLEAAPRTLLAFLSSGCLTCRELWTTIDSEGQPGLRKLGARLVVVGKSSSEESPAALADLEATSAPTVLSSEAWAHFGVPVSPYFVLVDGRARRVIGEGAGRSWSQVVRLLEQSLADAGEDILPRATTDRRTFLTGRDRERRADRALLESGIEPGDPSLTPEVPLHAEGPATGSGGV
jgi:hypothetical protein